MQKRIVLLTLTTFMLAACSSAPTHQDTAKTTPAPGTAQAGGGYLAGDGPNSDVPAGIDDTPDAIPRAEPLHRYANRPYKALGKEYTPLTSVGNYKERGIASWYGKKFNGQRTSIGETYDMYAMSAAHPTLPIPSYARVTNLRNHKSVVVRVNDRGPFLHDRIIDLSFTAAHKLGIIGVGSAEVEVESLAPDAVISPAAPVASVESTPLETPPPLLYAPLTRCRRSGYAPCCASHDRDNGTARKCLSAARRIQHRAQRKTISYQDAPKAGPQPAAAGTVAQGRSDACTDRSVYQY
jgi:rare lipoprotein A (peptidoglycan hydrolase)